VDVELNAIRRNCQTFIASRLQRAMDEMNGYNAFSFPLAILFRDWGSIPHASNFAKISFFLFTHLFVTDICGDIVARLVGRRLG
jgi:hypothetical protein